MKNTYQNNTAYRSIIVRFKEIYNSAKNLKEKKSKIIEEEGYDTFSFKKYALYHRMDAIIDALTYAQGNANMTLNSYLWKWAFNYIVEGM